MNRDDVEYPVKTLITSRFLNLKEVQEIFGLSEEWGIISISDNSAGPREFNIRFTNNPFRDPKVITIDYTLNEEEMMKKFNIKLKKYQRFRISYLTSGWALTLHNVKITIKEDLEWKTFIEEDYAAGFPKR